MTMRSCPSMSAAQPTPAGGVTKRCWPWLALMAVGLGLALRWIHIYLRPLHRTLQLFWLLGCLGALTLALQVGPSQIMENKYV